GTSEREEGAGRRAEAAHDREAAGRDAARAAGRGTEGCAPSRQGRPRARGPEPRAAVRGREATQHSRALQDGEVGADRRPSRTEVARFAPAVALPSAGGALLAWLLRPRTIRKEVSARCSHSPTARFRP